jgi:hypothetical protein
MIGTVTRLIAGRGAVQSVWAVGGTPIEALVAALIEGHLELYRKELVCGNAVLSDGVLLRAWP